MKLSNARYDMKQLSALWGLILVLLIGSVECVARSVSEIRMIEESAISYTGFLSKARFDQRFPGQIKPGPAELDSGWYVIYEHESLSYYFGPILLESTGQDYLAQLTQTVDAAVQQRPSITDYRLELSFEPTTSGSQEGGSEQSDSEGNGGSPPPPPSSFWILLRSIFGV